MDDPPSVIVLSALTALVLWTRRTWAAGLMLAIAAASLAAPSTASAGLVSDLLRDDVPFVNRSVWIVSSRNAPNIADCCSTVFGHAAAECYRAPTGCLEVYRRDPCGCLHRRCFTDLLATIDPSKPTVIFTHGSFITWDYYQRECPRTAEWLERAAGRELNVIFFAWPSDGALPTCAAAVRVRERIARTYSFYMAELLRMLPPQQPGCPTVLASHSHGGEMMSATLHLLAGGAIGRKRLACPPSVRPRALLFAPAMDSNDFNPGQAFDRALCATPAMAIIYSDKDIANRLYPLRRPLAGLSIGRTGLRNCDARKIGPRARRVSNVDLTRSIGCTHIWAAYLDRDFIGRTLRPYFN